MQIDIVLEPNADAQTFGELAALAEHYGIGTIWTANHPAARDPFMAFTGVAQATRNVRMGPVAVSPYELHPLKMANALLTLEEMSEGRASIVIGGGGGTAIAMGLKGGRQDMFPRMVRGVRECVEFLKQVGPDTLTTYTGEIWSISNYCPAWAPQTQPHIYVAASQPQMLRMGAQVADGIMMSDITLPLVDDAITTIRQSLDKHGRDTQSFRINNLYTWHVKQDRNDAYREARRKLWVRGMLWPFYISPFLSDDETALVQDKMDSFIQAYVTDSPEIPDVPDDIVTKLVDNLTFAGDYSDIDRFIADMKKFEAAGLNEFALRLYDDPAESIKLIGERVVPALG